MMRWLSLFVMAGGLAVAGPIVLTFDDLPAYSQVGDQYAADGVSFSGTDFGILVGDGTDASWCLDGTNGPYLDAFYYHTPGVPNVTLTFSSPVSDFSVDSARACGGFSFLGDQLIVSAYDGASLLGSQTITYSWRNIWSTASLDFSGITSITMTYHGIFDQEIVNEPQMFGIDNIVYTEGTPEPASAALVLIGAFALLLRRRLSPGN